MKQEEKKNEFYVISIWSPEEMEMDKTLVTFPIQQTEFKFTNCENVVFDEEDRDWKQNQFIDEHSEGYVYKLVPVMKLNRRMKKTDLTKVKKK